MKKEGKLVWKILSLIFLSFATLFPIKSFAADLVAWSWVEKLTSWIKTASYEVEWCAAHAFWSGSLSSYDSRFTKINPCQKGNFQTIEWKWVITFTWSHFEDGDVSVKKQVPPTGTRVSTEWYINLFSVPEVKIQWEGTFTISVSLEDYANNITEANYTYKVDKTAPQFSLTSITALPNYTYAPWRLTNMSGNIVKYDSNSTLSNDDDEYKNPPVSEYKWDMPAITSGHVRNKLYVLYFQNSTKWDGAQHPFSMNLDYSDRYNWYLSTYVASEDSKYQILTESGTLTQSWILSKTLQLDTSVFASQLSNTQAKYKLRIFDKSIWKSWGTKNYSEIIFYVVRDNTPPNLWWNGLASTETQAIYNILKFDSSTTAWDESANIYTPSQSGAVSKFIAASGSQNLETDVSDVWITGNGTMSWKTLPDKYAWYNAGLSASWWINIMIENANSPTNFDNHSPFDNRFVNNKKITNDFSLVDNNRSFGQRKYATNYETKIDSISIPIPWVCDLVWNCLNPKLSFRVVANTLNKDKTTLSLWVGWSMELSGKVFANGQDTYWVKTEDHDAYWNAIVGVTAVDNPLSPVIKNVSKQFSFVNGLYFDQRTDTPSWSKGAILEDTQTDNLTTTATGKINSTTDPNIVEFIEKPELSTKNVNAWTYSFKLASLVPSKWLYPYLSEKSKLGVTDITSQATEWTLKNVGYFPSSDKEKALGLFTSKTSLGSWDVFLKYNDDLLAASKDYSSDFVLTQKNKYWQITVTTSSWVKYSQLKTYALDFEYASPLVYGWSWFTLNHLINNIGQTNTHEKLAFKMWTNNTISQTKLFEKYLPSYQDVSVVLKKYTPNVFNIHSAVNTMTGVLFEPARVNTWTSVSLSFATSDWGMKYKTKSSVIKDNYALSEYWFNMGYVSYLSYYIDEHLVSLPSISRNVSDWMKTSGTEKSSRYYFLENTSYSSGGYTEQVWWGDYQITGDPIMSVWIKTWMWIAITGLSNANDLMLSDDSAGSKANINIGETMTRYDLIYSFKKNVASYTSGFKSDWINRCTSSRTSPLTLNSNAVNNPMSHPTLSHCTVSINGELVSFIKWNVDIDCEWTCTLNQGLKRSIVVQDGSTYIHSDISTYWKQSKFLIWTIANEGLSNVSIPTSDNPILTRDENVYWWTMIDPSVTNIDAFIVSQWPLVSFDGKIFNNPDETQLKNQLHIYGSLLSLNTLWGYKANGTSKCPYVISSTCDSKTAFIFDLVTLRRYSLEWMSTTQQLKPSGNGYRSWKLQTPLTATMSWWVVSLVKWDTCDPSSDSLRCITDKDYIVYTVFLEKNTVWSTSPSVLFQTK